MNKTNKQMMDIMEKMVFSKINGHELRSSCSSSSASATVSVSESVSVSTFKNGISNPGSEFEDKIE